MKRSHTACMEDASGREGATAEQQKVECAQSDIESNVAVTVERIAKRIASLLSTKVLSVRRSSDLAALVTYSILSDVPATLQDELLATCTGVPGADRAAGALCGLAIADALGAPLEFLPATDEPSTQTRIDSSTLEVLGAEAAPEVTKGKALQPGQWTDDASMALCLADSLLVTGRYCGSDIRVRLWNWWRCGYNNAFSNDASRADRRSIGLGMNVGKSLDAITDDNPPARYEINSNDSGNGSLIRLAPVPIAFAKSSIEQAMAVSAESSRTTHPGRLASSACRFLGFLLWHAINRHDNKSTQRFIDEVVDEYLRNHSSTAEADLQRMLRSNEPDGIERCWNWRQAELQIEASLAARAMQGTYNGYPVNRGYFGSFCLDGLAMALHCVYHSTNFTSSVVRCVNFLGDSDSTAAICGQIAGALYGLSAIDPRLTKRLIKWDNSTVACRAVLLWALGATSDPIEEPDEPPPQPAVTDRMAPLVEIGFSPAQARDALVKANDDVERAAQLLLGPLS